MTLRAYQQHGLDEAVALAREPRARALWVAPTGTGKTHLMSAVLAALPEAWLVTPSMEIIRSMLARGGLDLEAATEAALWRAAAAARITTPVRLRNRLRDGRIAPPPVLLVDEAHHATEGGVVASEFLELAPDAAWLGWTATPYRGSHAETEALREWWGEPRVLLDLATAARERYLSIPAPEVLPLLDDAGLRVVRGELDQDEAAERALATDVWSRLAAAVVEPARRWTEPDIAGARTWTRPTLIAVPTASSRADCVAALVAAGVGAAEISGETPRAERDALLASCRAGTRALVQIQVLAEGVDMPWLRRLIDLRPLRSPVAWMQLLGRVTRPVPPGEATSEYVCCCRNIERHAYLLRGEWPAEKARRSAAAFGGPPPSGGPLDRGVARDALRNRQRATVALAGGGAAEVVHLGLGWDAEALVVGIPGEESARVYRRVNDPSAGRAGWGRWSRAELPADGLRGWERPTRAADLSERQLAWYSRDAGRAGLDPASPPDRRGFPLFPALLDSRDTLALTTAPEAEARATALEARGESEAAARVAAVARDLPALIAEATALAERLEPAIAAADEPREPRAWSGTWARLRDSSDWGARLEVRNGARPEPGDRVTLTSRDGREALKRVGRVVHAGEGYALATVVDHAPATAMGVGPGRYAVQDGAVLRFLIATPRALLEQAGDELHPVHGSRRDALAALITADPRVALARYGRELGICGVCGRALTDEASRAAGIGPVCEGRMR